MSTSKKESITQGTLISHESKPLYKHLNIGDGTLLEWITKVHSTDPKEAEKAASAQGVIVGRKQHPFNMRAVIDFQEVNPHHTRCLLAKVSATVGLGFRRPEETPRDIPLGEDQIAANGQNDMEDYSTTTEHVDDKGNKTKTVISGKRPKAETGVKKLAVPPNAPPTSNAPPANTKKGVNPTGKPLMLDPTSALVDRQRPSKCDEILDPLCEVSWMDLLNDAAEDYFQCGAGAIEVVSRGNEITGLHHIPIPDLYIYIEDSKYNMHYEIENGESRDYTRLFSKWGDKKRLLATKGGFAGGGQVLSTDNPDEVSEVIYIRRPSSKHRFYGYPDWLSAVTSVELVRALTQYKYDFFNNRGVPEFMLWLIGKKLDPKDWAKVEAALRSNIGQGNAHKSLAMNVEAQPDQFKVQLEKLAMDGADTDDFVKSKDNLALDIVTAHGVPPLLAGIQIPGKLGANNELPNALMAFHVLVIGPAQRLFRRVLTQTLGNAKDRGIDLTGEDFSFRTIPEEIDVGTLQTISRMRTDLRTANAEAGAPNTQVPQQ